MAESSNPSSGYAPPSPKTKSSSSVPPLRLHRGSQRSLHSTHNNVHNIRGRRSDVVKNAPILRRTDFGEYHPDGGWGWVVCGASFLMNFLCHGLHLSGGVVLQEVGTFYKAPYVQTVLLISAGYGGSLLLAPFVTALIRRKSLRLVAVVGALVLPLAALFLSFSKHIHQAFVCWCGVMAVGSGFVLTTSSAIVGRYFRKRREIAEMLALGGSGVGMGVVTVSFRHLLSVLGWLRGWQAMALALIPATIACCFYRSAALYHPRRHAILHVRNLHKSKQAQQQFENKAPYLDFSPLSMRSLQVIMASAGLTALGSYTPFLLLPAILEREGMNARSTTLLQVFLGVAFAFGGLLVGLVEVKGNLRCVIVPQYFCQLASLGCGVVTLMYIPAKGFYGATVYTWTYGLFCGAHAYSLKIHTCEMVTLKVFERAWGYVMFAQALPTFLGPTIAMMVIEATGGAGSSRVGFVFAAAAMILGSAILCLTSYVRCHPSNYQVIQAAYLQAKSRERDLAFLEMDISKHDDCSANECQRKTQRSLKPSLGDDDWSEIEAMSPMSSTDKVTEFLLYTQSVLQTYSEVHQLHVPNVRLEINSEDDSESTGSDVSPMISEARAIKSLKLEATVSRSARRPDGTSKTPQRCTQVPNSAPSHACPSFSMSESHADESLNHATQEVMINNDKKCEMMTTV